MRIFVNLLNNNNNNKLKCFALTEPEVFSMWSCYLAPWGFIPASASFLGAPGSITAFLYQDGSLSESNLTPHFALCECCLFYFIFPTLSHWTCCNYSMMPLNDSLEFLFGDRVSCSQGCLEHSMQLRMYLIPRSSSLHHSGDEITGKHNYIWFMWCCGWKHARQALYWQMNIPSQTSWNKWVNPSFSKQPCLFLWLYLNFKSPQVMHVFGGICPSALCWTRAQILPCFIYHCHCLILLLCGQCGILATQKNPTSSCIVWNYSWEVAAGPGTKFPSRLQI